MQKRLFFFQTSDHLFIASIRIEKMELEPILNRYIRYGIHIFYIFLHIFYIFYLPSRTSMNSSNHQTLTNVLHICYIFFCSIGIWINLLTLVAVLICLRRLVDGQRYASWIGILFSNLFLLVIFLLENTSAILDDDADENNGPIFLISTFPALFLIVNIILTWLDLFIFLNFTYWYKKYFTHLGLLVVQVASFALFCILINDCYFWKPLSVAFESTISLLSFGFLLSTVFIVYVTLFVHCKWVLEKLKINANDPSIESTSTTIIGGIVTMNQNKFSPVEIGVARGIIFNVKAFFSSAIMVLVSLTTFHVMSINIRDQSLLGDSWLQSAFRSCYFLCMSFTGCYTALFSPIGLSVYCHHLKVVLSQVCGAPRETKAQMTHV